MSNALKISPKFFLNERANYGSWTFSFWRELFQNSIDAGSRRIDITIEQEEKEDRAWVDFVDDGCGMSRDVLENVYFTLGETTKTDQNTIGGFGKARILTCFSQHQYELWSGKWYAIGHGSTYDVTDFPFTKGCRVKILVDATKPYGTYDMLATLREYLSYAQIQCDVYVNGECFNSWCYKRQVVRQLSFGYVHANKSGGNHPGILIVRVLGVPMFIRFIDGKAQVVVEVSAAKSREILVSNRDMLNQKCGNELDSFIQELAIDKKSALRRTHKKMWVVGFAPNITKRKIKSIIPDIKEAASVNLGFVKMKNPHVSFDDTSTVDIKSNISFRLDQFVNSAMVVCESENPRVRKVVESYNPSKWKKTEWTGRPGKPYFKGRVKRDLLRLWTVACESIIEEMFDFTPDDAISWRPGFLFSDDSGAINMKCNDGITSLLINPVDSDGKLKFHLRDMSHWAQLISLAVHEVTHIHHSYHDENWASLATELFTRAVDKRKEIVKRMKESLKAE